MTDWQPGQPCPFCGDPVPPNRERRSDKSPSYKCVNPDCTGGKEGRPFASWYGQPPRPKTSQAGPGMPDGGRAPVPVSRAPVGSWSDLRASYERCVGIARQVWGVPSGPPSEALVAATATVFIEANKRGLVVKVVAPVRPRPTDFEEVPAVPTDGDDFLPF